MLETVKEYKYFKEQWEGQVRWHAYETGCKEVDGYAETNVEHRG